MNIKIFMNTAGEQWEREVLLAMGQGIQRWIDALPQERVVRDVVRIGRWEQYDLPTTHTRMEYEYGDHYVACDVAVIFGSWKQREKGTHITRGSVATQARRFLCVETALLKRRTDVPNTHFRIGLNGFMNQDAEWPDFDAMRGNSRLAKLEAVWPGWRNDPDGHIVLCLQLPGDASLRGADINDWAWRAIQHIRSVTDRPITVRCHPLASNRAFQDHMMLVQQVMFGGVESVRFSDGAQVPWHQDLDGAYCTVTYTSGLAIDSVLTGIPTIACDPGNFAWELSSHDPREVTSLHYAPEHLVLAWLQQLALCQWSLDEMRDGEAWLSYLPLVSDAS